MPGIVQVAFDIPCIGQQCRLRMVQSITRQRAESFQPAHRVKIHPVIHQPVANHPENMRAVHVI
jgi:hypothetical protein